MNLLLDLEIADIHMNMMYGSANGNAIDPHVVHQSHHQYRFNVNVWVGIIGNNLVVPYLLSMRLTGVLFEIFLRQVLPKLLDDACAFVYSTSNVVTAERRSDAYLMECAIISRPYFSKRMDRML